MPWKAISAKIPGIIHPESQDHFSCRIAQDSSLLTAAMADGCGSAHLAAEGSRLAASTFAEHIAAWYGNDANRNAIHTEKALRQICADAFAESARAVMQRAKQLQNAAEDLATTLVTATVNRESICVRQTGDGAVVAMNHDETMSVVLTPDRGPLANQTKFITMNRVPAEGREAVLRARDIAAAMVFTDGLERILLDAHGKPHPSSAGQLLLWGLQHHKLDDARRELQEFLERQKAQGNIIDDAAISIIVPATEKNRP